MISARDYKMDVLKEQLATSQKTEMLLASENVDLRMENAKLRKLARKNWYIAMSERKALRIMDQHPDEEGYGDYIETLDAVITEAKAYMLELGIEVDS